MTLDLLVIVIGQCDWTLIGQCDHWGSQTGQSQKTKKAQSTNQGLKKIKWNQHLAREMRTQSKQRLV